MSIRIELICTLFFSFILYSHGQDSIWIKIDNGLFYTELKSNKESIVGDSKITIIQINPKLYSLKLLTVSELDESGMTARNWVDKYDLICAINAGMFQTDYKSNVGYMKNNSHINNPKINEKYLSIAAFNPVDLKSYPFKIYDSDKTDIDQIIKSYNTVIQNLRLIKRTGDNRWGKQNKKWSEVSLGQDTNGNILFIFSRAPFSMFEFNENLLSFPIDIACAQHLEGGPEASLYFNHNGTEIIGIGSYETDFSENDNNNEFWPIPNVIGLLKN